MKSVICIMSALMAFAVHAEPPPSANYLPPSNQPSQQYGPPPTNAYIPPSNSYIPPQQSGQLAPKPSANYGAPSQSSPVYQQAPQAAYGAPGAGGAGGYGGGAGGHSNDYEQSGEPAHYNFEYAVQDYQSGNDFGHMEQRDGDLTTGRYYVLLPDGRKQVVTYEADRNGYRPTITYEQTGQAGGQQGGAGGYNGNAQGSNGGGQFNGY